MNGWNLKITHLQRKIIFQIPNLTDMLGLVGFLRITWIWDFIGYQPGSLRFQIQKNKDPLSCIIYLCIDIHIVQSNNIKHHRHHSFPISNTALLWPMLFPTWKEWSFLTSPEAAKSSCMGFFASGDVQMSLKSKEKSMSFLWFDYHHVRLKKCLTPLQALLALLALHGPVALSLAIAHPGWLRPVDNRKKSCDMPFRTFRDWSTAKAESQFLDDWVCINWCLYVYTQVILMCIIYTVDICRL